MIIRHVKHLMESFEAPTVPRYCLKVEGDAEELEDFGSRLCGDPIFRAL